MIRLAAKLSFLTSEQKRERGDRMIVTRNKLVQQAAERVNGYFKREFERTP
ncbi:DNA repair protein [Yersinia enterocolitica]|nr:DNA repair protein [Yersinia enterocolitica]